MAYILFTLGNLADFYTSSLLQPEMFSHNMTAAYILREMLANVLGRLQYHVPEVPIDAIVDVVLEFYRHYLNELFKVFHDSGDYRFFLAGFCADTLKVRVFKFDHSPKPSFTEILLSSPFSYDCIGSGEPCFRNIAQTDIDGNTADLDKKMFSSLRKVIEDPSVPDVGGLIQTGTFEGKDFKLFGVLQHDLSGHTPRAIQAVGGLPLEDVHQMQSPLDLHIRRSFKLPFEDDLRTL